MDELELLYKTKDEIPEGFESLYTERDGAWHLTKVKGLKTEADVVKLNRSLTAEREAHKKTKEQVKLFAELGKPEELRASLDKLAELEATAGAGNPEDKNKVDALVAAKVEARLKVEAAKFERQIKQLGDELTTTKTERDALAGERKTRTLHDAVRTAALSKDVGLRPEALEDALTLAERVLELNEDGKVVTRDGVGVTPGLDPAAWLAELQPKRPHWWPESVGGGARGSKGGGGGGGINPWSHEHWNVTAQTAYFTQHGADKAAAMAKAAGTSLGAGKPPPRKA